MILEHCQLLSTAHRVLDKDCLAPRLDGILYKATHANHPSAIWVRKSNKNYLWLANLTVELCYEYTHRYGKIHKCQDGILPWLLLYIPKNIPEGPFTEPPQAMPEEVKVAGNSVEAYRKYYINNKAHLASWKNREVPQWYRSAHVAI